MSARGETFGVSDHALLRFLERAGELDVEGLRQRLADSLDRAHRAARSISESDYPIRVDGVLFVVRGETVTTVLTDREFAGADALRHPRAAAG